MPRQYVTPAEFTAHPIGIGLNVGALGAGVLDGALARASARCDRYCRRKLGQPGTTTVGTGGAAAGATSIPLVDVVALAIDGTPDVKLQIGTGATQETVQISGLTGINLAVNHTATANLLPGTAFQYAHAAGEAVVALYYEQTAVEGGSTNPSDQFWEMTQAGQIAHAHAPHGQYQQNVRVVFLKNFPIVQIVGVAVAYPWANVLDPGVPSDLTIVRAEGWYRFSIGSFDPPGSVVHTTYTAGFAPVPDDVRLAVIYEAAAELGFGVNYLGAQEFRRGDYSVRMTGRAADKAGAGQQRMLLYAHESSALLDPYRNPAIG